MNKLTKNVFQVCLFSFTLSAISIYVFLPTSFSDIIKFIQEGNIPRKNEILDFKIKKAYANIKFDKFQVTTITNISSPFVEHKTKNTNGSTLPTLPNNLNLQIPSAPPPIPSFPKTSASQQQKLEVKSIISTENEKKSIVSLNGKSFFVGVGDDSQVGYINNITTNSVVINGLSYPFEK